MAHLLSHSVVIRVVNGVVSNDSVRFGWWLPQQGDRGGGHVGKSHILRGVKWFWRPGHKGEKWEWRQDTKDEKNYDVKCLNNNPAPASVVVKLM